MLFFVLFATMFLNQIFIYSMEANTKQRALSEPVLIVYVERYITRKEEELKNAKDQIDCFREFNELDLAVGYEKIQRCGGNVLQGNIYLEKNKKAQNLHSALMDDLNDYKNIFNLVLVNTVMKKRFYVNLKKIQENKQKNIDNLMMNWVPLMRDHCAGQRDYDFCSGYFGHVIMDYIKDFSTIFPPYHKKVLAKKDDEIRDDEIRDFLNIMSVQQLLLLSKYNVLEKRYQYVKNVDVFITDVEFFLKEWINKYKKCKFYYLIPVDPLGNSSLLKYVSDQNGIHITYEYFPAGVSAVTLGKNQLIKSPSFFLPDCI